jgi:hypothetical protein
MVEIGQYFLFGDETSVFRVSCDDVSVSRASNGSLEGLPVIIISRKLRALKGLVVM